MRLGSFIIMRAEVNIKMLTKCLFTNHSFIDLESPLFFISNVCYCNLCLLQQTVRRIKNKQFSNNLLICL